MLLTHLKVQLRQGLFLIPLMLVPLFLFTKSYVLIFFFLQSRFFRLFQQTDFPTTLMYLSGNNLKETLYYYNLSWAIWFNFWFVIAQLINLFYFDKTILTGLIELFNFNSVLFMGFIVGNIISNSDMITVKSSILRMLGSSFVFGLSISIAYAVLKGVEVLNITPVVNIAVLFGVIATWSYHTKQQNSIKFIQYYL